MRRKVIATAAVIATTLGVAAPVVDAYTRGVAPSPTSVICYPANDAVYVAWDKSSGKPASAWFFVGATNYALQVPGSAGSKGYWYAPVPAADGDAVTVRLMNKWGSSTDTAPVTC